MVMPLERIMCTAKMVVLSLMIAIGLAACGVRGSLEVPPEAKAEQEQAKAAAKADPSYKPPHKDFILDGLLR